jgi:hypothetical protein
MIYIFLSFLLLVFFVSGENLNNFYREGRNLRIPPRYPGEEKVHIAKKPKSNPVSIPPQTKDYALFPIRVSLEKCAIFTKRDEYIKLANKVETQPSEIPNNRNCFTRWRNPYNDFCGTLCTLLFGNATDLHPFEVHHHLVQMILNIRSEKEKRNLSYRIDKLALLYWNNPKDLEAYPNNYIDRYELTNMQGGLEEILRKVINEYDAIIVEFGQEMICSRAMIELLLFSKCTVIVGIGHYKQLNEEIQRWKIHGGQLPSTEPFNSLFDAEIRMLTYSLSPPILASTYNFTYFLQKHQFLLYNMSNFAYSFALHHLTFASKCYNLYNTMGHIDYRNLQVIGISATPPSFPSTTTPSDTIRRNRVLSLPTTKHIFNNTELSQFIVVVSRFQESYEYMDYLVYIPHLINNRGDKLDVKPYLNIVHDALNKGRESSVYLKYIIDHYENLPQIVVFTQALPIHHFDHNYPFHIFVEDIHNVYVSSFSKNIHHILSLESDGFAFFSKASNYIVLGINHIHLEILFATFSDILGKETIYNRLGSFILLLLLL